MTIKTPPPDPAVQNLATVFGNDKFYTVPRYQRNYKWTKAEVKQLMEDLVGFYNSTESYYLLGQLIVTTPDDDSYTHELIDGQQRISTLTILFAVLHKRLEELKSTSIYEVRNAYKNGEDGEPDCRIRVRMSGKASDSLMEYSVGTDVDKLTSTSISQGRLVDAIQTIKEYLVANGMYDDAEKLRAFAKKTLSSVLLTQLTIYDADQANAFYDRVNTRGLGLDASENLKNRLFQNVNESLYEDVSDRWSNAEVNLYDPKNPRSKDRTVESLLLHLYKAKSGKRLSSRSSLYDAWKEYTAKETDCIALSKEIESKSVPLNSIISGYGIWSNGTKHMNFVQNYAVRLAGSELSTSSKELLEKRVEAIAMLWLLAEQGENDYDTMASGWVSKVAELAKENSDPDIEAIIEATPASIDVKDLKKIAKDRIAELRYDTKRSGQIKRLRYVLARVAYEIDNGLSMAYYLKTTDKRFKDSDQGYDLDHISPLSGPMNPDFKNSLGNLALLKSKDNSSVKDADPRDKVQAYMETDASATRALCSGEYSSRLEKIVGPHRIAVVDGAEDWSEVNVQIRTEYYIDILIASLDKDLGV
jgi:hypothetical protein